MLYPLFLMGVLAFFSLMPEKILSQGYAQFCKEFFGVKVWYKSDTQRFSNFGHLLAYATLLLTMAFSWRLRWWLTGLLTLGVGILFEVAQLFTVSRQASLYDLGYNALGIVAGLALWAALRLRF
jgi:VanZ family protein